MNPNPAPQPVPETPAVVREVFATRQVVNQRGETVELSSNVSGAETALLHHTVRERSPAASVEIGFAQGVSTLAILDALRRNGRGHHHVIDPFQSNDDNCGRAMVRRARLDEHYTFYERFADEVIPGLPRLQFAFIESSHLFDLTLSEFVLVDRRLDVGGVVGLHDMWMPAQQSAARYILANRDYTVWPPAEGGGETWWKQTLRRLARAVPRADQIFAADFLVSWRQLRHPNLILLRKTAEDGRDWRFHRRF